VARLVSLSWTDEAESLSKVHRMLPACSQTVETLLKEMVRADRRPGGVSQATWSGRLSVYPGTLGGGLAALTALQYVCNPISGLPWSSFNSRRCLSERVQPSPHLSYQCSRVSTIILANPLSSLFANTSLR
jgi:hypothetical protein